MSVSRVGLSLLRGVRHRSSAVSNVHPGYSKTNPIKEKFSIEDGTPVFQKGGTFDRLMYGATMIMTVGALGFVTNAFYIFSLR